MVCGLGSFAAVYFAVGPISMRKADRSARSVRKNGGTFVRTMLVTDDQGARKANRSTFDVVESIGVARETGFEFVATRPIAARAQSTAERWRNRSDPANTALRFLRGSKIDAIRRALRRFDRCLFLDADTYVCSSLEPVACALEAPRDVAFVPVATGREHASNVLSQSKRWRVPRTAREANTGVLAARNSSTTIGLTAAWREAYEELATQSGFLMDQPAFRAALHATQADWARLPDSLNCRGHQRARSGSSTTAVPLKCSGFQTLRGAVQTELNGGAGCVVLHSHDIQETD